MGDVVSLETLRGRVSQLEKAKVEAEKVTIQHQAAFDAALANLKDMFDIDTLEDGEAKLKELREKVKELTDEVELLISSAEKAIGES